MEKTMKWSAILAVPAVILVAACSRDSASNTDTLTATADTSTMSVMPADSPAPVTTAASGNMMDPNAASATDLSSIPDVTPQIASAITAGRPYTNNVALGKVLSGTSLTEQQRDSVYARLWTPIDLNTATDEEILLIPGVGSRMLREFKEYRPYTSMDQFRREIGKYVDDAELARLERFVAIR
jgi:DNA uptake protein ComE-like DNA-binding protein